jgi:DNA replication and repair protein RecF
VHLKQLKVYQYRNFASANCSFSPGMNYLVGSNAQGKTNLIEAINFLSVARSFRTSKKTDLIKWEDREASIFGTVQQTLGDLNLGVVFQNGKSKFLVNNNPITSASEFVGRFVVVSFFPDDLELVKAGPSTRRKLIDRHCVDINPSELFCFLRFNQALRNKSELLKSGSVERNQLEAWNYLLAQNAIKITKARRDFIERLNPIFSAMHAETTASLDAPSLTLKSDFLTATGEVLSENDAFLAYQQVSSREIASRRSLFGSQRDDIDILLGERSARAFASQGQSRSLVLSLKIAITTLIEQQLGDSPLLLLDDVDSELDLTRRDGLFSKLLGTNRQIIMTGTDSAWQRFPFKSEVSIRKVVAGSVRELE